MCFGFGSFPFFSDKGGANLEWYERPEFLCTHRPQIRSSSTASGTFSSMTLVTDSPLFSSTASRAFACSTVRGNPSRMNPFAQSLFAMRSAIMPHTISSVTSAPDSIACLASLPTVVPAETAARNISPVLSWGVPSFFSIAGACVPFPAPGGPKRIRIWRPGEAPTKVTSTTEVVVLFFLGFGPPSPFAATFTAATAPATTTAMTLNFWPMVKPWMRLGRAEV
mmetsp:Transcript_7763/g.29042  ORF Transcript_7763/g.29042 Transcript_7763/m.29042 type:complete len:223 (+) Transcript_7763:363-1031(+)